MELNKQNAGSLFMLMLGFAIFPASLISGGKLATLYNPLQCVLLILLGNLALGLYAGILGYISVKRKATTHQLIEQTFGRSLGRWISLLLALTQVGWFGVGIAFFAQTAELILPLPHSVIILLSGALMMTSAWLGMRSMVILSFIAVPAIILLGIFSLFYSFQDHSTLALPHLVIDKNASLLYFTGFMVVVGSFVSGATFTPDYIHTASKPNHALIIGLFAFLIGNSFTFLAGMFGAHATGQPDLIQVLIQQGFSYLGLILLGLSVWTSSDNSLYTCSLSLSQFVGLPRRNAVLIAGLIGTLCADLLYEHLIGWLKILSLIIPPVGIILMCDYWRGRSVHQSKVNANTDVINVPKSI